MTTRVKEDVIGAVLMLIVICAFIYGINHDEYAGPIAVALIVFGIALGRFLKSYRAQEKYDWTMGWGAVIHRLRGKETND